MPITLADALERLPKVELHCHIEGTMRPGTVLELGRQYGVSMPTNDLDQLYKYRNLDEFLTVFWMVQECLMTREDWARLAYESVVDAAAHGRVYAETFFTPARHLAQGQKLAEIVAGLNEGIERGEAETGARCFLIADIDRAYGPSAGLELVEQVVDLRRSRARGFERIIGIGMDSTEFGVDSRTFKLAFRLASANGLRCTAHQGEDSGPDAIADCINVLGVERIDHGLSLLEDPELTRRFAAERIPLTVCPTSNVLIANRVDSLARHPLAAMRAAGILATLNTDDPALINIDLGYEYRAVSSAMRWEFNKMVGLAHDGVDGSWLDDSDKLNLHHHIDEHASELRDQLNESSSA